MIIIEPRARQLMTDDAVRTFPDECCGFLFGIEKEDDRIATDILVVTNAKEGDRRRRFEISPKDYMKAEQYADENNLQLLGIYHSHPNHPAIPSEHDRAAAQPWFSYVIISVLEKKVGLIRSWKLNEEYHFIEEKIHNYQFI
jgi:proteasome lid subunit RPN8/RPN11